MKPINYILLIIGIFASSNILSSQPCSGTSQAYVRDYQVFLSTTCVCPGISTGYTCLPPPANETFTFTDVIPTCATITGATFVMRGTCTATVGVFLNGVSIGSMVTTSGCLCTDCITFPLPPIVGTPPGFVRGGANTITYTISGSACMTDATFTVNYNCAPCNTPPTTSTPTLGQWGLIIFGLLIWTIGTIITIQRRKILKLNNGSSLNLSDSFSMNMLVNDLKSNLNLFFKIYFMVFLTFIALFIGAGSLFNYELTTSDIPGSFMASGIIALMLYYVYGNKKS